jgi:TRAP-type C4-dicarboxylate transport system permease small subunit
MKQKPAPWLVRTAEILWKTPLTLVKATMIVLSLVVTGLVGIEVLVRYITFSPQLWVEELCLFVVFWYYFAGAVYATYKRSHISGGIMNMVFRTKPKVQEGIHLVAAATSLALSGFFAVLAFQQFAYSLQMNPRTIHLLLPLAYSRLALSVGFSLMIIYFLAELIASIRSLKGLPAITAPWSKQ